MDSYMDKMRANYNSWMQNAIGLEKDDWTSDRDPEVRLGTGAQIGP